MAVVARADRDSAASEEAPLTEPTAAASCLAVNRVEAAIEVRRVG